MNTPIPLSNRRRNCPLRWNTPTTENMRLLTAAVLLIALGAGRVEAFEIERLSVTRDVGIANGNLRVRSGPSTATATVTIREQGTRVAINGATASEETIDGITARWIEVELPDSTHGWCFGGYLLVYRLTDWAFYRLTDVPLLDWERDSADGELHRASSMWPAFLSLLNHIFVIGTHNLESESFVA